MLGTGSMTSRLSSSESVRWGFLNAEHSSLFLLHSFAQSTHDPNPYNMSATGTQTGAPAGAGEYNVDDENSAVLGGRACKSSRTL